MSDGWNLGRDEIGDLLAPTTDPHPNVASSPSDWRIQLQIEEPMSRVSFFDDNTLATYLNKDLAPYNAVLAIQDANHVVSLTDAMYNILNQNRNSSDPTSRVEAELLPGLGWRLYETHEETGEWKRGDLINWAKYKDDFLRALGGNDTAKENALDARAAGSMFELQTPAEITLMNQIAGQEPRRVRGPDLMDASREYNNLFNQKENFLNEKNAIGAWATKMGINIGLVQEAMGLNANSSPEEVQFVMQQLQIMGYPMGLNAGNDGGNGAGKKAVLTYLESEGLKTAEVQRQLADFLTRGRAMYEFQDDEQAFAERAMEANASWNQPWNLSYGYGIQFNPYRTGPRLSEIIKKTIPSEVLPDYRLGGAVGLPGGEEGYVTDFADPWSISTPDEETGLGNPWASDMGSAAGYAQGTRLEGYAGGSTDDPYGHLAEYESMVGVGTSLQKKAFRRRPGHIIAGFDQNGNPVHKGVVQG